MSTPPDLHAVTPVEALLARVADLLERVENRLAALASPSQQCDLIERQAAQLRACRDEVQRLRGRR